jgi:hypothetical protein
MKQAYRYDRDEELQTAAAQSLSPQAAFHRAYSDDTPELGSDSCARGTILIAFREAVHELYGNEGLERVSAALPKAVRAATIEEMLVGVQWLPEEHVVAWFEALWAGPCDGRADAFALVLQRMLDRGFGRVRKAFLRLASPEAILAKAPSLWRYDHTHGRLGVEVGTGVARVRLENHTYTESPLSRLAISEIYRYCAALTRVRQVTESHFREPSGALVVTLRWRV